MEIEAIQKAYRRYARLYDFYFGALFQPGRRAVIQRMDCRSGERILEVGVGTGLSLPLYPAGARVTGIDISSEMLDHARRRQERLGLTGVELHEMDAERMTFPDDSFDKVVAMYVASVVPDPVQLVREMRRVCRPGGELCIVNHFHSTNPVARAAESLLAPLSRLIGFHPDVGLEDFIRRTGLEVIDRHPVNLFGYWTLLRASNNKLAAPHAARAAGGERYRPYAGPAAAIK